MRSLVITQLGVLLIYAGAGAASPSVIPLPIDLEWQAVQINVLCTKKTPDLKPSIMERFRAWKDRLGPYYSKYQQWNYEFSVQDIPQTERQRALSEFKAKMVHLQMERLKELESTDSEALEFCHKTADWLAEPKYDAEVRRLVDEQNRHR
jgi:hypothetical protein